MEINLSTSLFSAERNFLDLDESTIYDVLIIGGGPAGLTAAVYCMRKGLATALVAESVGGQVAETSGIENYLGYRYIDGSELVDKFREQVLQFGIAFAAKTEVTTLEDGEYKLVTLKDGRKIRCRTLIVASGKQSKKLQVPGENELIGHGVAYCAICDAPFYAGRKVVVAGGGNSGLGAAIDLAKVATHVTIIQRRDRFTGDQILIDKLAGFSNVDYRLEHHITSINGSKKVESVTLMNRKTEKTEELATDGVFVEIGLLPKSQFTKGILRQNEFGEIIVDCFCRTSSPGIFAAGDVTSVPYKQIIIACGEGAKAALSAADYLLNT